MGVFQDRMLSYDAALLALDRTIVVDVETGGTNPDDDAILEVCLVWVSHVLVVKILDEDGHVGQEALEVNHIDMDEHVKYAVRPDVAATKIEEWLSHVTALAGAELTLAGHNVAFDIGFMARLFRLARRPVPRLLSPYRTVDTHSLLWSRIVAGKLPPGCRGLDAALNHYGIKCDGRHTSKGDAIATRDLLRAMILEDLQ